MVIGTPTPGFDMFAFGLPIPPGTCFLYSLPIALFAGGVPDAAGTLTLFFLVPPDPGLAGSGWNLQGFQLVPPVPIDLVASSGVTFVL